MDNERYCGAMTERGRAGGDHGPLNSQEKKILRLKKKIRKLFCLLARPSKKFFWPLGHSLLSLFNWVHLIWNDSFIVKIFSLIFHK